VNDALLVRVLDRLDHPGDIAHEVKAIILWRCLPEDLPGLQKGPKPKDSGHARGRIFFV
jgi:hypothetical protein